MTYEEWMREVNVIVERVCGMPMEMLPDWLSRDAFEDELTPEEGAEICLEESGFYDFVEDDD